MVKAGAREDGCEPGAFQRQTAWRAGAQAPWLSVPVADDAHEILPAFADAGPLGLCISEVQAANHLIAIGGVVCDWIEALYNGGSSALDLSGYGLSDASALPYKAVLRGTLAPDAYLVVKANSDGLGFNLKREGERIMLTSPDGRVVDAFSYEDMPWDAGMARVGQRWQETWTPTPGYANAAATKAESESLDTNAR